MDMEKERLLDMLGISSSWLAVKGLSIRDSIEKAFGIGFNLVEVGAAHRYEEKAVDTLMDVRKRYPGGRFTLHGNFPPLKPKSKNGNGNGVDGIVQKPAKPNLRRRRKNGHRALNLADPKEHEATLKAVKKMYDIAYRLNADVVGIHGGFLGEVEFVETDSEAGFEELVIKKPIPPEQAQKSMMVIMQELVNLAEEKGIRLAIEFHNPMLCKPVMKDEESFDWLFSTFKSKFLGILLDVGHLHMAAREGEFDPYAFADRFKDKVFEIHLHDVKGGSDHNAAGTGDVDFARYLRLFGRPALEKIPMVFEYKKYVTEQQACEGKALIEGVLNKL